MRKLGKKAAGPARGRLEETPQRTTATAFPRYSKSEMLADSMTLQWPGLYARHSRLAEVVDRFLVPATPEPLIACVLNGTADFDERELDGAWIQRKLKRGDIFITRSRTPYELRCRSPKGEEVDFILIHLAVDVYLAALERAYPGRTAEVEVVDFFGRDEALAHLCYVGAELLFARAPGKSARVAGLREFLAAYLVEKYIDDAARRPDYSGGLPIHHLRRVEDHVRESLDGEIAVETLAELVGLSPFHFSRVFKQATGATPMQFVTRERINRAQQLARETSRSMIDIALEVGYSSPSHFAQVFRRVVGVTPTEFRSAL